MKTLQEVLEPFTNHLVTTEIREQMVEAVKKWGEETNHYVYPVAVEPAGPDTLWTEGTAFFDATFEYKPKT